MSQLTITADCGGSNGARVRLWKVELQKLADETNLTLHVHHYPPGTSKWNKIEHRLFCHITQNWRGRPLTSRLAVVELISATTTKTGLKIECALDERTYQKGIKVTVAAMKALDITGDAFHPEWNYTIKPRTLLDGVVRPHKLDLGLVAHRLDHGDPRGGCCDNGFRGGEDTGPTGNPRR